jgi:hypothetical protein
VSEQRTGMASIVADLRRPGTEGVGTKQAQAGFVDA